MRRAFRHTGVLMVLSVVALGLIGAAYTLWFEDLRLNVVASTGTFDADMSIHPWNGSGFGNEQTAEGAYDNAGHPVVAILTAPVTDSRNAGRAGLVYQSFPANKADTAPDCDASLGHFGTLPFNTNDVVDSNQLDLQMSGLFPYAGCEYRIDIHNSGTVPLHLSILPIGLYQQCEIDGSGCVNISTSWPALSFIGSGDDARCTGLFGAHSSLDPNSLGQLQLEGTPVQLHEGDSLVCDIKIVLDEAYDGENKLYKVQVNWRAYQWNELPAFAPNNPAPAFRDGLNGPNDKLAP